MAAGFRPAADQDDDMPLTPALSAFAAPSAAFVANAAATGAYPEALKPTLSLAAFERAKAVIGQWPGYAETPLVSLPALSAELGVASVAYKDEGGRFGLGSFKALGGAYAVFRLLAAELEKRTGKPVDTALLAAGKLGELTRDITVTCATDGNHGRSVAWGARLFGAKAVIFIHATVSEGRAEAIRRHGAEVVRTAGNYDDSVREADRSAKANGWFVVSDTSYPGYVDVPRDVMQGYAVMVAEALAREPNPTHVFIQGGVGGLAAAVTAQLWETLGAKRPVIVVVEPDQAACLYESAKAGKPTVVEGALDTIMAGLACGEPSLIAWPILAGGVSGFMAIPDGAAADAMRLLASGTAGATVVGGESGVAGLAGLIIAAGRPDWRHALKLDGASRVLLFGSEGDTDPELYAKIVGKTGDAVRKGA